MAPINLATQRLGETEVVHITGAVDSNSFPNLAEVLSRLLKSCRGAGTLPQVILECSQINYIGSGEFREILNFANRARSHGGDIKCAHLAPTLEQIGNLIANGDLLECHPDVTIALNAFQHSPLPA